MTRLAALIFGPSFQEAKQQMEQAHQLGADLVEIRLDWLDAAVLKEIASLPHELPWIFTFRKRDEGGAREIEEEERLRLLKRSLSCKPEYCDIEASTDPLFFEEVQKEHPLVEVICSFHYFGHLPSLDDAWQNMQRPGVLHYKMALAVQSVSDALKLLVFAGEHEQLSCMGLGEAGAATRILAPLVGSEFCYAPLEDFEAQPGQVSLRDLQEIYRFKSLSSSSRIYALLGHPVAKSIGHLFHNRSFPKDAVYLKLDLDIPELPLFFSLMRKLPFAGFSVTMPLKEQMGRFLSSIDPTAERIGSVNTLLFTHEHLAGFNTDGEGALNALERHKKVQAVRIALLGAGGTGRAIAYAALQRGAKSVVVLNRTFERAELLAKELGCEAGRLEDLNRLQFDILINTIPTDLLLEGLELSSSIAVMDVIYWEKETPLLKLAREKGCLCIHGVEMFEEQARLQQKIWFQFHHQSSKFSIS